MAKILTTQFKVLDIEYRDFIPSSKLTISEERFEHVRQS